MSGSSLPAVLVTGASSGIGAVYAERFARRGHDLVLVARDAGRMDVLATRLRDEFGVKIEVLPADLTDPAQLARVEERIRSHETLGILINNAGASLSGGFTDQSTDSMEKLIQLNITAPTRLAKEAVARFIGKGEGAIINIASVLAVAPEFGMSVYSATKSYVLHLSQALQKEIGPHGVYVQAVLPAATRTEIWERSGRDADSIPGMMDVGEMVDAALVGFDRREAVTIPPLPDAGSWDAFEAARHAMMPGFGNAQAAERYRA
jgi:uncharacterized protein